MLAKRAADERAAAEAARAKRRRSAAGDERASADAASDAADAPALRLVVRDERAQCVNAWRGLAPDATPPPSAAARALHASALRGARQGVGAPNSATSAAARPVHGVAGALERVRVASATRAARADADAADERRAAAAAARREAADDDARSARLPRRKRKRLAARPATVHRRLQKRR